MIYLLLGSNKGDRWHYLHEALTHLAQCVGTIEATSSVYSSLPWGDLFHKEEVFLNQAIEISTTLTPSVLMSTLLAIEKTMGRDQTNRQQSRCIDIDILLYGNQCIDDSALCIPHPRMADRRFALVPLVEIAPDVIHPVFRVSISELLATCSDPLTVALYNPIAAE